MNIRRNPLSRLQEKINHWTLIEFHKESRKFTAECKCGFKTKKNLQDFQKQNCCNTCKYRDIALSYVGKKINKLTVIGISFEKGKNRLKVKCECGNEYLICPYQLTHNNGCCKCKNGFIPGKDLDGMTIIEYVGKRKYKLKCVCGEIFETIPRKYNGKYATCGCKRKNSLIEEAQKRIGLKYENLQVKKVLGLLEGRVILELKCKCGNKILRKNGQLFKSKSCGCIKTESLPQGERAFGSKLKDVEVKSMREFYDSGQYTTHDLMEMYDLPYSYIRRIVTRKIWKNIN